jgi:TusA-related sulfurtransferase
LQKNPLEFRQKLQHRINAMTAAPIQVNARRLLCPLPVIRVQQAIEHLTPGTVVTAVCTDPGALHDITAWARIHGHNVLETRTEGREYTIVLKTGTNPGAGITTHRRKPTHLTIAAKPLLNVLPS